MAYIKTEDHGHVLLVTIDRPDVLNALSRPVLEELQETVDSVDCTVTRCVVLTGSGEKAFVAGADIGAMAPLRKEEARGWAELGGSVFGAVERLPVPVIAAVNGYALGGGCELALACDIRLASERAVFGQPEVALGVCAGFGGTQRLPRLIGEGRAKLLLYTGMKIKAQEALDIGLIDRIYPADQLLEGALKLAQAIAENAPLGVRATKAAIAGGRDLDLCSALALEAKCFGDCFESSDQRNAMAAMLEKRKPQPFLGR